MTGPDANLATARRFLDAMWNGRIGTVTHMLTPQATLYVPGHNALSGRFVSRKEISAELQRFFGVGHGSADLITYEAWFTGPRMVGAVLRLEMQLPGRRHEGGLAVMLWFGGEDLIAGIAFFPEDQHSYDAFVGQTLQS